MRLETRGPTEAGLRRENATRGLVSVIIPAFNSAHWIDATIASARSQTYQPIEIVLADDGSADATVAIAESLGARVVRSEASGPGGARNAGLEAARGEFIQFLDADDLLAPGKIARQIAVLESADADVAWEPFDHFQPTRPSTSEYEVGRHVVPELGPDLAASFLTSRGFVQLGALLVRRSQRTDGVWFATGREVVEDVRYVMALAMAGARFVSTESPELGLLFRQHTGVRYSTRPADSFARGCADLAAWAEAAWNQSGGLTSDRRDALGEAYAFAARQLAGRDPTAFRAVAARGLTHGESFLRHLPSRVRWLSRLVGYPRAESIAASWRRVRARAGTSNAVVETT